MFTTLARKVFGTVNDRILKAVQNRVDAINALEPEIRNLSDEQLKDKTVEFKKRLENNETLDDILEEAFAVVREAARRVLGMRHFDVQLIGGIILHRGQITEMKTGEGKTLAATLPSYLNALTGDGVHVVTVNDYLVERDSKWMGQVHEFLGLSVGYLTNDIDDEQRRAAYACDITYGTNNEFGFDYLRDNMKFAREEMVQRKLNYAIIDEVDSILIDEARTPLIISGPTEDNSDLYVKINKLIPKLGDEDYDIDEKSRSITLTEDGNNKIEELLRKEGLLEEDASLYEISSIPLVHHINQALKAHKLFTNDTDYIVRDGSVMIIDEFTGRMMEGRRYSDGLHQALEAKEGVNIQNENQTLASVTFQNYFRMYKKLSGMTGTAMTEADEFADIYKLDVVAIPPNLTVTRQDLDDDIYCTEEEKYSAILEVIDDCYKRKQPVLVGTISIEKSEQIASLLKKKKIPHNILNAKHHQREAYIISQAGRLGAVTIATNMAGRGTDIMLGGNPELLIEEAVAKAKNKGEIEKISQEIKNQVKRDKQEVIEVGGLYVLGTERHESRRIDNQLRGRSGRQGDPGVSKFFLSLQDDLMRIFGSERISGMLQKLGLEEGEAITHPWISRAIEKAQQKVEAQNYEIRKNLLKYDDVMNDQRKVVYEQRIELMESDDVSETIIDMQEEVIEDFVNEAIPAKSYPEQWDVEYIEKEVYRIFGKNLEVSKWAKEEGIAEEEITQRIKDQVVEISKNKEKEYGSEVMRLVEKNILLMTLDQLWKDHLLSLDHLRQGIGLRAYGQKDPLNEYKREAFAMFEDMLTKVREEVTKRMSHMQVTGAERDGVWVDHRPKQRMHEGRSDPALAPDSGIGRMPVLKQAVSRVAAEDRDPANPETWGKVSRNEVCPCGSGKKYKQCHGKLV
ncbi:preprotein translocase subunit SecA [Rickettsiales bacterium]|nr:preprotein translocase subunit SecA [Rickettsiales bacterium]